MAVVTIYIVVRHNRWEMQPGLLGISAQNTVIKAVTLPPAGQPPKNCMRKGFTGAPNEMGQFLRQSEDWST